MYICGRWKREKKVSSGELESFLFHFIKFIIVSSAECNVAWCFWHKMYQRRIWNEKRDLRIFSLSLSSSFCACYEASQNFNPVSFYFAKLSLEFHSRKIFWACDIFHYISECSMCLLIIFLPHHHRRRRLSRPFEAKASERKKGQGREGIWIE